MGYKLGDKVKTTLNYPGGGTETVIGVVEHVNPSYAIRTEDGRLVFQYLEKMQPAEHGDDAPDHELITNEDYDPGKALASIKSVGVKALHDLSVAQMELEVARETQDQLRDELTAVTAERDALKELQEIVLKLTQHRDTLLEEKGRWTVLRREIRDAVMQADANQPLTNELYELLK